MMDKIREAMTRKIGPLPAWAWGALAAGGVWIFRGMRGNLSAAPEPAPAGSLTGDGSGLIAGMPSFGAPFGEQSPLYVTADDYGFSIDGDPGSSLTALERLLAQQRSDTETGGGGYVPPAAEPVSQPAAVTAPKTTVAAPSPSGTTYMESGATVEDRNAQLETNYNSGMELFRGTWMTYAEYQAALAAL